MADSDSWINATSPGVTPKITSIYDFSAEALGQLKVWLEQAGLNIPINQVVGYNSVTQSSRVQRSSALSLTTATLTKVTWQTEVFDYGGMVDITAAPTKLTVRLAGKYVVVGNANFDANATGQRLVEIIRNGTRVSVSNHLADTTAGNGTGIGTSGIIDCAVGDYLELQVSQSSGGNLNLQADAGSSLSATRVGS